MGALHFVWNIWNKINHCDTLAAFYKKPSLELLKTGNNFAVEIGLNMNKSMNIFFPKLLKYEWNEGIILVSSIMKTWEI